MAEKEQESTYVPGVGDGHGEKLNPDYQQSAERPRYVLESHEDLIIWNADLPHSYLESFRFLKTNLILATLNKKHSAIIVTSTAPGEGKTITAVNYAISLAREGKRVLLLDLDLRKPRAQKIFKLSNKKGFTSLILDPFSSIPLTGSLSEIPLIDLIYLITHNEKSGVLRVFSSTGNFTICFVEGKIAQIDSSLREESEKVGNLLINKMGFSKDFIEEAIQKSIHSKTYQSTCVKYYYFHFSSQ